MKSLGWGWVLLVSACSSTAGSQPHGFVDDAGEETYDAGNVLDAAKDSGGATTHDAGLDSALDAATHDAGSGDPNFGRACPVNQFDICQQLLDGLCEDGYTSTLGVEEHNTCTISCGNGETLTCEEAGAPPGSTCEGPDTKGRHVCIPPH
jgi:hypothetical protein